MLITAWPVAADPEVQRIIANFRRFNGDSFRYLGRLARRRYSAEKQSGMKTDRAAARVEWRGPGHLLRRERYPLIISPLHSEHKFRSLEVLAAQGFVDCSNVLIFVQA